MTIDRAAEQATRRAPPHDLDAERALLGAMLLSSGAAAAGLERCQPSDFYKPAHGHIFAAIRALMDRGGAVDALTVTDELKRSGVMEAVGNPSIFTSLQASTPSIANARHYASIVAEQSLLRQAIEESRAVEDAAYRGNAEGVETHARQLAEMVGTRSDRPGRLVDGGVFVAAESDVVPLWGADDEVLWSSGEELLIVGPTGVGKTSLAQQLVLHRMGLRAGPLLGMEIPIDSEAVVLYLAMDRPGQAARSLRRMVSDGALDELDRRLKVWRGPPERDLARFPEDLVAKARSVGAGTVVVDSLKDAALKLTDDEVGAGWNRAAQLCLAEGVELIVLHHQRKAQQGAKPNAIDDVYGSTWITAGAGSVVLLWGSPGDVVVELLHLKQPVGVVGPLKVEHDHPSGTTTLADSFDLLRVLRSSPHGLSASDAAHLWFESDSPDHNERRRAKRALDQLVERHLAHRMDARKGGEGGTSSARYFAVTDRPEEP